MNGAPSTLTRVDDTRLIALILSATERLVFLGPGMSQPVAEAICERWADLGAKAVNVVVDVDPEICRLGYGEATAVRTLQETAVKIKAVVCQQPGIRIGLVIADDQMLIYTPTPLLVEAGSTRPERPNAIQLGFVPPEVAKEVGLNGNLEQKVGLDPVGPAELRKVEEELKANPPIKFDIARHVRVFNTRFEFVEFELRGCFLSRRTVPIPSDLMGLAKDAKTQKLLRSSFRLVDKDSEFSGERVMRLKQWIADRYLIPLPGYGTVVLRANKEDFETAVKTLRRYVRRFQRQVEARLQKTIDANREALLTALAPAVIASPPSRWLKWLGKAPKEHVIRAMLDDELAERFGSAHQIVGQMEVSVVYKGVTYESLTDPKFIEVARRRIPRLEPLHEEFDAARQAPVKVRPR